MFFDWKGVYVLFLDPVTRISREKQQNKGAFTLLYSRSSILKTLFSEGVNE